LKTRATPANVVSALRLAMAPVLIHLTVTARPGPFLVLVLACLASDALDGWLARRLGQASAFGAALDTWADFAVFVTVPVCGWWLWPDRVRPEAPFLCVLAVSYTAPIVVGYAKYGRLTNHRTWGGKASAIVLAAAGLILVAGGSPWFLRVATLIVVLSDLQEIAITLQGRDDADRPARA
jgi:phosphatidylglycerophosphate synthase